MIYSIEGKWPEIRGQDYFIAESADVIGSVIIENNVSIWHNTVIRGDIGDIIIGEGTNVQDGSVLHTDMDGRLKIGSNVSVGHMAVLHNCEIGDNTLVGINAVILSNAKVGRNCIIGASSLVTGKMDIPDNSMVMGSPARVVRPVTEEEVEQIKKISESYILNFKRYSKVLSIQETE